MYACMLLLPQTPLHAWNVFLLPQENGGRGASIDRPTSTSVVDIDVNPSQRDYKTGKAG